MENERRLRLVLLICLLLSAMNLLRFTSLEATLDDAWISFRIARNWVEAGVPTFDLSRPPVEGMTNLSWTVLMALWYAGFGGDPILFARILGGLCFLGTVAVGVVSVAAAAEDRKAWAGGVTGVLIAASGTLAYYALSGLETALWGFLYMLSLSLLPGAHRGQRSLALGAVLAALAWTRPEGVLVGGLLLTWLVWERRAARDALYAALLFGGGVVLLEGFRLWTYGSWLPNTFYAKPPAPETGWAYILGFGGQAIGVLGVLVLVPAGWRHPVGRVVLALAAIMTAAVGWSGGDWMPGYRRMVDVSLSLAWLAGVSAGMTAHRLSRLSLLGALVWLLASLNMARDRQDSHRYHNQQMEHLGRLLSAQPHIEEVALFDIGRFGWAFPREIFDTAGLTDAHIAHLDGTHGDKYWDEEYFRSRSPDVAVVLLDGPFADPLPRVPLARPYDVALLRSLVQNGGYHLRSSVQMSHPGEDPVWMHLFLRDGLLLPEAVFGPLPPFSVAEIIEARRVGLRAGDLPP